MRLTRHADLAMRVLMYLALTGDRRATIQNIAGAFGISRNHLMKVVHELACAGYVDSARGAGGGLRLARQPAAIRVGDVIADLEPDFGLVECFRDGNCCVITPACRLPAMLQEALEAFMQVLGSYTLADLVTPANDRDLADILRIRLVDSARRSHPHPT